MKAFILMLCASVLAFGQNLHAQNYYTLDQAIDLSVKNSPKIKMLEAQLKAAEQKSNQDSNLPDPVVSLGLVNMPVNSFSFTQEPMTGKMVSLSQGIPYPGKLSSIKDASAIDTSVVHEAIKEEINKLRMELIQTYADYQFNLSTINLLKEKKKLIENIGDVVRSKYSVGEASQQNVLNTDLTITGLEDRIEDRISMMRSAEEKINALIAVPGHVKISASDVNTNETEIKSFDEVEDMLGSSRPLLRQNILLRKKAELKERVSEYTFYPDFKVTLQYNQRDELAASGTDLNDFFSVIVGFNLPINYGGKKTSMVEESKSIIEYYRHQYDSQVQLLKIDYEKVRASINSLIKRKRLLEDVKIIQANENFNASLSAYQVGQIDFINVTDAVNKLLDIEIELEKIRKELRQEYAKLEFLTGNEILEINNEK